MTTKDMLEILLNDIKKDTTAEISNPPREIPHGGMAVDVKHHDGNPFHEACYQVYGTEEVLSHTLEILRDNKADMNPKSQYAFSMMIDSRGQSLSGFASVKMFSMDDECEKHLLTMKSRIEKMNLFSNSLLLHKNGEFEFIIDMNNRSTSCRTPSQSNPF